MAADSPPCSLIAPLLIWDANCLGFQLGVHKQEAIKGFDMQQLESGFYIQPFFILLQEQKRNKLKMLQRGVAHDPTLYLKPSTGIMSTMMT